VQREDKGHRRRRAAHKLHNQLAAIPAKDAVLVLQKDRRISLRARRSASARAT
jgi:hypothetical protein